jgi:hypothetical protein
MAETLFISWRNWLVRAYILESIAWEEPGETRAAEQALGDALDLAAPSSGPSPTAGPRPSPAA